MTNNVDSPRTGLIWYSILFVLLPIGFFFHEVAHYLAGIAYGEQMRMSLNSAWAVDGGFVSEWAEQVVSAAGPLFTIGVALAGTYWALKRNSILGYALVYSSFLIRLAAFAVSVIQLNDEARISVYFGWPWFVLPFFVNLGLFALTAYTRLANQCPGVHRNHCWNFLYSCCGSANSEVHLTTCSPLMRGLISTSSSSEFGRLFPTLHLFILISILISR